MTPEEAEAARKLDALLAGSADAVHDDHRTLAERFPDASRGFAVQIGDWIWVRGATWAKVSKESSGLG